MESAHAQSSVKVVAAADGFGAALKDALVEYLRTDKGLQVEDLGVTAYYKAGEEVGKRVSAATASAMAADEDSNSTCDGQGGQKTLGLCVCGTGVGVSIFANKFPRVYAAACESVDEARNCRSINNSNVLALGAKLTPFDQATHILDAWLSTPFKAPCPANDGNPWPDDIQKFLDDSIHDMAKIPAQDSAASAGSHGLEGSSKVAPQEPPSDAKDLSHGLERSANDASQGLPSDANDLSHGCPLCDLASHRKFVPIDIMPGGSMSIVREDPTSAIVRFKAGSLEPAHHHTFGHDLIVTKGQKRVWNLTKNQVFELGPGDFLYTPAGDLHRVQYLTDTEFFIKWDGHWDIFIDEDLTQAAAAIEQSKY